MKRIYILIDYLFLLFFHAHKFGDIPRSVVRQAVIAWFGWLLFFGLLSVLSSLSFIDDQVL